MSDNRDDLPFKPVASVPWNGAPAANSVPLADILAIRELAAQYGEPMEDWCRRMNTSDEPEAVAFRERWARTESGRPKP